VHETVFKSLSFGLLLLLAPLARAGEAPAAAPRWEESVAEALKRARSENRLVVVDFWRDNCIFCVRLEGETFADQRVIDLLRGYVLVRVKNTDHPDEIERYRVESFPTLALLDGEGKAIEVLTGFMPPGEFISWLSTAADRHRRFASLSARLAKDPGDMAALLGLGRLYSGDGKREEARDCFEKVVRADPQGKLRETAEALLEIGLTWRRSREYRRAVEALSRAREIVLARAEAAQGEKPRLQPAGGEASKKEADRAAESDLLDRVLYELATTHLLAGKREGLVSTLEEYDARVRSPDARRHSWVLLQLGQEKKKAGHHEAAKRAFRRCDELYPRSMEARECREALASLE
jgi:thioredoxin-related protein